MLVTDRHRMRPNFTDALTMALNAGARLIQLREKDLNPAELLQLAKEAAAVCRDYGATLIVNGPPEIAIAANADGTQWPEALLHTDNFTALRYPALIHGASIHGPIGDTSELDYLVFGSIYDTNTHPDATPAGIERLAAIAKSTDLPVYAIGGITSARVPACLKAGAHGAAVIGAVWLSDDIESATQGLIETLEATPLIPRPPSLIP